MSDGRNLKPFIKWAGGKREELKYINQYIPENIDRYFEPFVGGGAVYLNIKANSYFINDKSSNLISLYNSIRNQDEVFLNKLNDLEEMWVNYRNYENFNNSVNEEISKYRIQKTKRLTNKGLQGYIDDFEESIIKSGIYNYARFMFNSGSSTPAEKSAYYFFTLSYCYGGVNRYNSKGEFNVPYAASYNKINLDYSYLRNPLLLDKLGNTSILNLSFDEFLCSFGDLSGDDFIFLDPPYDSVFKDYEFSSFGEDLQRKLGEMLFGLKCKWMVVIADTPLIREIYSGKAEIIEYDKKYKVNINNANKQRDTTHLIINNY